MYVEYTGKPSSKRSATGILFLVAKNFVELIDVGSDFKLDKAGASVAPAQMYLDPP